MLHRGVQVMGQDRQGPPGCIGAEQAGRQLPAGEVALYHRMDLLALAAALAQPPDDLIAGILFVGHDAEQLAGPLAGERLCGERQVGRVTQRQLAQRLADCQEPVIRPVAAVASPVRHVADLGPFLVRLLRFSFEHADQGFPFGFCRCQHGSAKCRGHVGADGEVNYPEPRVFAFATVQQQLFLVACGVRAER